MNLHFLGRGALAIAACLTLAAACSDDADDGGSGAGAGGTAGSSSGGSGGSNAGSGGSSVGGRGGSGGSGGSATAGSGGSAAGTAGSAGAAGAAGAAGSAGAAGAAGAGGSGDEPDAGGPGGDDTVTYADDIQPILLANCSPCHAGNGNGGHDAAISYDDAVAEADEIVDEIESGSMPEEGSGNEGCNGGDPGDDGCVSAEDFALIQQWVEDGTPE